MAQSAEIETLDQLLGGELRLSVVRQFYPSDERFCRGVLGLLQGGEVRLFDQGHAEVPSWRWRPLLERGEALPELESFTLQVTPIGAARVT